MAELKDLIKKDLEDLELEQIKYIYKLILCFKKMTKEGR